MTLAGISDLTIDEFRELLREVVIQTLLGRNV